MPHAIAQLTILCVGRTRRSEFRQALPVLERWGTVLAEPDVASALARLEQESAVPDVIVIAQSYPGEFSDRHIERLRQAAPLARLVALLGSWCEGELRTGTPWPGAVRVYWHQWTSHAHCELARLVEGRESVWSLPPTACEEERCLAVTARKESTGSGVVEIITRQYDVYQWLAAACTNCGYRPCWRRWHDESATTVPPHVVLFDAAREPQVEIPRMQQFRGNHEAPVIVLADFPRHGDRDRYLAAGAHTLLSRPFYWDNLFWHFLK